MEFLDNILEFSLKRHCSGGELGLTKKIFFSKYHEPFPILVFEVSHSIEITL